MTTDKDDQNMNTDQDTNAQRFNADNDFGLPEAEYSPLETEQPEFVNQGFHSKQQEPNTKEIQPQQKQSSWPMWIALVVILVLAGVFVYFYAFDGGQEEVVAEEVQQDATPVVIEEPEPAAPIDETEWETAEPEAPAEGSVTEISSRTGNYHLIVGSFIDSDLARDYAEDLAGEGNNVKIIAPSGTRKFYRLSVKDAESISTLEPELENMRAKYGENVWIVKY